MWGCQKFFLQLNFLCSKYYGSNKEHLHKIQYSILTSVASLSHNQWYSWIRYKHRKCRSRRVYWNTSHQELVTWSPQMSGHRKFQSLSGHDYEHADENEGVASSYLQRQLWKCQSRVYFLMRPYVVLYRVKVSMLFSQLRSVLLLLSMATSFQYWIQELA